MQPPLQLLRHGVDSGTEMTIEELRDAIAPYPGRRIIWTGGEPTLQLTEETVAYFKTLGYHQSIETNGTRRPPADWTTSPVARRKRRCSSCTATSPMA